ncbi:MAG TPA: hypothetical protein ENK66_04295 [Arcobacter sp.]|nr:hypothetical protein [Arcobacter sp.]
MELVYLWVENYKNIHKQGFNFSPRFNCHYDGKELTIKENDDYIENFFGDNINVTAIVGKNGSGKSSVLELIIELMNTFFERFLIEDNLWDFLKKFLKSCIIILYDKKLNLLYTTSVKQVLLIINKTIIDLKQPILLENLDTKEVNVHASFEIFESLKKDLFLLHYDYSFSKFRPYKLEQEFNHSSSYSIIDERKIYDNHSNLIKCVPKKDGMSGNNNILSNPNFDKFIIIEFLVESRLIDTNNQYFNPTKITINKINDDTIFRSFNNLREIRDGITVSLDYLKLVIYFYMISLINNSSKDSVELLNINSIDNFFQLEKFIEEKEKLFKEFFDFTINKEGKRVGARNDDNIANIKEGYKYLKLLEEYDIENLFNFEQPKNQSQSAYLTVNIDYFNNDTIKVLSGMSPKIFNIFILDENGKEYNDLSNGEKSALRIQFYIERAIFRIKKNNFFILLDEPANDMHPEWQKKLSKYLVDIFKGREENIHFIFTSHSPFMISDLPKENVIFLDTYKKEDEEVKNKKQNIGNCKVLIHNKVLEKKQTFGANIHTLLSDSFFMEDGLMGEFAKQKINEIIEYFNNKNNVYDNQKDKLLKIINAIGEPFLKDKLLKMYDDKYPPTDEERIRLLEKQIERIKNGKN